MADPIKCPDDLRAKKESKKIAKVDLDRDLANEVGVMARGLCCSLRSSNSAYVSYALRDWLNYRQLANQGLAPDLYQADDDKYVVSASHMRNLVQLATVLGVTDAQGLFEQDPDTALAVVNALAGNFLSAIQQQFGIGPEEISREYNRSRLNGLGRMMGKTPQHPEARGGDIGQFFE